MEQMSILPLCSSLSQMEYADRITWVSTYQFLQVLARDFTDQYGRALLLGEAAHLFALFGARGMNSGIADAIWNLKKINTPLAFPDSSLPPAQKRNALFLFTVFPI